MYHQTPVVDFTGCAVGTLVGEDAHALKVQLGGGRQVWIRRDAVLDSWGGQIVLICYASGVDRWLTD